MIEIDKNLLRKLYIDENKTTMEISTILGCSTSTIRIRLYEYGIPVKPKGNYKDKISFI